MSGQQNLADSYDGVYSAAAGMLWLQESPSWRQEESGWPQDRRAAWQALETLLLTSGPGAPVPGEPSDPARHLISRRAPGDVDRPLTFSEAVQEWRSQLASDPGFLVERQEPFPDYYMEPGSCVVVPAGRHMEMIGIFPELFRRLAPGRPGVAIGADAAELSDIVHEAADALRAPLGGPARTPHPGAAAWISPESSRVSQLPDLTARFEALRSTAWRAAEAVPPPEELKAARDFSVKYAVARAAAELRSVLEGRSHPVWHEKHESIDPARHLVQGAAAGGVYGQPKTFGEEAASWRKSFAQGVAPWTPREYQRQFYPDRGETDVVLSATRAAIFAELLDEVAARIHPGRAVGLIHYDAYELGQFITWEFGRELRSHSGF